MHLRALIARGTRATDEQAIAPVACVVLRAGLAAWRLIAWGTRAVQRATGMGGEKARVLLA